MNERKRKLVLTLIVTFMMCLAQIFTICAMADDGSKVTKIKIRVTNSDGNVRFTSTESDKYTVQEGDFSYSVGDTDIDLVLTVSAQNGYYFYSISKGDIKFSNDSSGVKCTDVSDSESQVRIYVTLSAIKGKLEAPDSAWWGNDFFGMAEWDEVDSESVTGYKVSINGHELTTNGTCLDVRQYLNSGSNNYFKVKAYSNKSGVKDSAWTKSEKLSWSDRNDYNYGYRPPQKPGNTYTYEHTYTTTEEWVQYNGDWYYIENGQRKKGWLDSRNGYTYYLENGDGKMVTGWKKISSNWYYFYSDGHMARNTTIKSVNGQFDYYMNADGKMEKNYWQRNNIGWYYINSDGVLMNCESKIDGSTYRFNSDGYMITGWYYENNAWYYYYLSGQKAYNTIIDGQYWLDSKGKWIS